MTTFCAPKHRRFSTEFTKRMHQENTNRRSITDLTWIKKNDQFEANFVLIGRWGLPANIKIVRDTFAELKEAIINHLKN